MAKEKHTFTESYGKEHAINLVGIDSVKVRNGKKTVIRLPITGISSVEWWLNGKPSNELRGLAIIRFGDGTGWTPEALAKKCPYGQPGSVLWVRETWKEYEKAHGNGEKYHIEKHLAYEADLCLPEFSPSSEWYTGKWKSSVIMPRRASRTLLESTDISVERLQDISEEGAIAEGISRNASWDGCGHWGWFNYVLGSFSCGNIKESFMTYWDYTHSRKGQPLYNDNPWVWVIKVKVIETEPIQYE